MSLGQESGILTDRVEYVTESTVGKVPSDPSWELFSDVVKGFDWTPDAQIEAQRGLGSADPYGYNAANESHELTVTYDLQQSIVDDALNDALTRSGDLLPNTHTIIERNDSVDGGNDGGGLRIYTVVKGAHLGSGTVSGEAGSAQPISSEISYTAEKIRSYAIHQPSGTTSDIAAKSTSSNDTSQTLHIEDDSGSTTATISLTGDTVASSTAALSSIDSVELDAETEGDVTLYKGTSDSGTVLAKISGSNTYDGREGDLGVPQLGSGSHASDIGSSFEFYQASKVERPSSTDLAYRVSAVELSVDNSLDTTGRSDSVRQEIGVGPRTVSATGTVMGPKESHDQIMDHLKATQNDLIWTLSNSTLTVPNAVIVDSGNRERGPEDTFFEFDSGFEGEGLTVA